MRRSRGTLALVISTLVVSVLAGCATDTKPADKPTAAEKPPVAQETPTPVPSTPGAVGVFDDFQYEIPAGWIAYQEGAIGYAVPPGMTAELDDPNWGDIHKQIEPYYSKPATPTSQAWDLTELVEVVDVTSHQNTWDGFEYKVSIPSGTMLIVFTEDTHEAGITTINGHAYVKVGSTEYAIIFHFGESDVGIPRMKEFLGTISVNA